MVSVVPAKLLLPDLLPRVVGKDPVVVEGCDEVIPRQAGVPPGGVVIYVWRLVGWGTTAPHWHPSATSRWRRASRVPSVTACHPTLRPSQPSSSRRSAAARSFGSMRSRGHGMSPSRDRA